MPWLDRFLRLLLGLRRRVGILLVARASFIRAPPLVGISSVVAVPIAVWVDVLAAAAVPDER